MTITLGTLDTLSHLHGTIKPGAWEYSRTVQTFFGVIGEVHLQGRMHGRELTCWLHIWGYASHQALHDGIEVMNGNIGESGTLSWVDGSTKTFSDVVFDGWSPEEDPWYDAAGVNGWQCLGTLKFRQVKS